MKLFEFLQKSPSLDHPVVLFVRDPMFSCFDTVLACDEQTYTAYTVLA